MKEYIIMSQEKGTKHNDSKLGQVKKCLHTVKITHPDQVNNSNKIDIKKAAKRSEVGNAIVDAHPGMSWERFDHEKFVEIRAAFVEFLNSKTTTELYTKLEINNLLKILKYDVLLRMQESIKKQEPLSKKDAERVDKLVEHLATLHKLRYGEKKVIAKLDFSFIRDLTQQQ